MSNDRQLNSNFKQWLQNLGETSRRKLLPVECSADFGLYASTARKMTNNLAIQPPPVLLGSQAEQLSSRQVNTDNSSGKVIEDVIAEAVGQSVNFADYRIPVDEVSRVSNKFSQVDAQTQTCPSLEAVKQDFDQASGEGEGGGGAEDNSMPDIVFSSTSSSGHSQATSPDVLLSGPKCIGPLSAEQNTGECPSPPESQSREDSSAKKCMMSSGYATQGSELSELSMAGDDDIFSPPDNKDPTKLWRLLQSSTSLISGEFPSSETVVTVVCGRDEEEKAEAELQGKDEEEKTEAVLQNNRHENDRKENLSTEANALSSAVCLHFEWRDEKVHEQLKDLAQQMIRRGEGVSYVRLQLYERLNSLELENERKEAETIQGMTANL